MLLPLIKLDRGDALLYAREVLFLLLRAMLLHLVPSPGIVVVVVFTF